MTSTISVFLGFAEVLHSENVLVSRDEIQYHALPDHDPQRVQRSPSEHSCSRPWDVMPYRVHSD
jgi:hypothetical protein